MKETDLRNGFGFTFVRQLPSGAWVIADLWGRERLLPDLTFASRVRREVLMILCSVIVVGFLVSGSMDHPSHIFRAMALAMALSPFYPNFRIRRLPRTGDRFPRWDLVFQMRGVQWLLAAMLLGLAGSLSTLRPHPQMTVLPSIILLSVCGLTLLGVTAFAIRTRRRRQP